MVLRPPLTLVRRLLSEGPPAALPKEFLNRIRRSWWLCLRCRSVFKPRVSLLAFDGLLMSRSIRSVPDVLT